jgi:CDP-2,3-bis-(O-geranylgeranyl)-sn-glycerol synthase
MLYDFFAVLYLAIPAFVANMIPIVTAKLNIFPSIAKPIDANKTWRGHAILGKNKTWRGLFSGIIIGAIIALIQFYLPFFDSVKMIDVPTTLLFGAAAGFGALFGDAIASIIKRQLDIPSGRPFIPLDQIDYILGFILCTIPFVTWTFWDIIFLLGFALIANPATNATAYLLGVKNTPW